MTVKPPVGDEDSLLMKKEKYPGFIFSVLDTTCEC